MKNLYKLFLLLSMLLAGLFSSSPEPVHAEWKPDQETPVVTPVKKWRIGFNTQMDDSKVHRQTIYVLDEEGRTLETTSKLLSDGKTALIWMPGGYEPGTYTLHISKNVQSSKGLPLKEEIEHTFRVEGDAEDYIDDRITLGTTYHDVIRIMGQPDDTNDLEELYYGHSHIQIDHTQDPWRVVGWVDRGDLRLKMQEPHPKASPITLGSTRDEVLQAMGTPSVLEDNHWEYKDESDIYFKNKKVKRWTNKGSLFVPEIQKDPGAEPFFLGSTMEEVQKAMGTPTGMNRTSTSIGMEYGHASVGFDRETKKLVAYNNWGNTLPLAAPEEVDHETTLQIGLSKEKVYQMHGPPNEANHDEWFYGSTSSVLFDEDGVKSWSNGGELRVDPGTEGTHDGSVGIGSSKEDVLRILGFPKGQVCEEGPGWQNCTIHYSSGSVKIEDGVVTRIYLGDIHLSNVTQSDDAPGFWIGSTREDVLRSNGKPSAMSRLHGTIIWEYGESKVYFYNDGKVGGYENNGELDVKQMEPTSDKTFQLRDPRSKVIDIMGTPDAYRVKELMFRERSDFVNYGESIVSFNDEGLVSGWNDQGNLSSSKVSIEEDATPLYLGMTKEQVKDTMGAPTKVKTTRLFGETYYYGSSSVKFSHEGIVSKIENVDDNLKLSNYGEPTNAPIKKGDTYQDVLKSMGDPETISYSSAGSHWGLLYGYENGLELYFNEELEIRYYMNREYDLDGSHFKIILGEKDPSIDSFTIGSSKMDVVSAVGYPVRTFEVTHNDKVFEEWRFPRQASVTFDENGHVFEYRNKQDYLNVYYGQKVEGAAQIAIGSTKEEVQAYYGTPTFVGKTEDGQTRWRFGYDSPPTVLFDENDEVYDGFYLGYELKE